MFWHLRNLGRLLVIAHTLARNHCVETLEILGFPRPLLWVLRRIEPSTTKGSLGLNLANAAVAMGPSFIKLGQALSTRSDLLGAKIAGELGQLRDQLPPFSPEQARNIIETELGSPIGDLFSKFNDEADAAASIAQVHFAVTNDGHPVAVKVLRPNIERDFAKDIRLFYWIADCVTYSRPKWRRLRLRESVQLFEKMVKTEMDLRLEAAAASELLENFRDDPTYRVPTVDWERTSKRVLTTERIYGTPIDQTNQLVEAGHDLSSVLDNASKAMFNQIFRDGFFHGDPHPGNLFIDDNGAIRPVDFGIMGRLDLRSRRYISEVLLAIFTRDYDLAARLHFHAGYVPTKESIGDFSLALRSVAEPILNRPAIDISVGRLLGQLFHVTETFGMETQPHLLLLQKVIVVAEGVGRTLNPNANLWEIAQPSIKEWVIANKSPEHNLREITKLANELVLRGPYLLSNAEFVVNATKTLLEAKNTEENVSIWHKKVNWVVISLIFVITIYALAN